MQTAHTDTLVHLKCGPSLSKMLARPSKREEKLNKRNTKMKNNKFRKKGPCRNKDRDVVVKKEMRDNAETPERELEQDHTTEVLNPPRLKGPFWERKCLEKLVKNVINSNNQFQDMWESLAPEDQQKLYVIVDSELAAFETYAKSEAEKVIHYLLKSYCNQTSLKSGMDSHGRWEEKGLSETKGQGCREENLVVSMEKASEDDGDADDGNVDETAISPQTAAKILIHETPRAIFDEKQQLCTMGKQERVRKSEDGGALVDEDEDVGDGQTHEVEEAEERQDHAEPNEEKQDHAEHSKERQDHAEHSKERQDHVEHSKERQDYAEPNEKRQDQAEDNEEKQDHVEHNEEYKDGGEAHADDDDEDADAPVVELKEKWEDEEKECVEHEESVCSTANCFSDPAVSVFDQIDTPKIQKISFQGHLEHTLKNREACEHDCEEEEEIDVIPETPPCSIRPTGAVFEETCHIPGLLEGSAPKPPKWKDLTIIALGIVFYVLKRFDKLKPHKDEKHIEKNPEPTEDDLPSSLLTGSPAEQEMTSTPNNLERDFSSAYKAKVKRGVRKKNKNKKKTRKRKEAEDTKTGDDSPEMAKKACCVDEAPLSFRRKSSGSLEHASYKTKSATLGGVGQGCETNNNSSGTGQAEGGGDSFQGSWRGGGGSGRGGRRGRGDDDDDDRRGRKEMFTGGKEPAADYKAPKKKTTKHGQLKHDLEATLNLLTHRNEEVQSWQEDKKVTYLENIQEMTKCFLACLSYPTDQCDSCTLVLDLMRHLASCSGFCQGKCLPALNIIRNHVSLCIEYPTTRAPSAANHSCRIEICQEIVSLYCQESATNEPVGLAEFLEKDVVLEAIRAQLQRWLQGCNQESQERPAKTQNPQEQSPSLPVPGVCGPPSDIFSPGEPASTRSNTVHLWPSPAAAQQSAEGLTQTIHTRGLPRLPHVNHVASDYSSQAQDAQGDTSPATPSLTKDNEGKEFTEQEKEEGLPVFHELLRKSQAASSSTLTDVGSSGSEATLITHWSGGSDTSYGKIPASDDISLELQELVDSGSGGNWGTLSPFGNVFVSSCSEKEDLLRFANQLEKEKRLPDVNDNLSESTRMRGVVVKQYEKLFGIAQSGGRYDLRKEWDQITFLGSGRCGVCILAVDRTTNFKFVVKKIPHSMFKEIEVLVLSHLDHPNIVKLYGLLQGGDYVYLLMEFVFGDTLHSMIVKQLEYPALEIYRSLLEVLVYLKDRGVIHNDIKADNILVREGTFEIVLIDYGLAVMLHPPATCTAGGLQPVGAPVHLSPEKARSESYDYTVDVWAATCTFKHCITGRYAWTELYPDVPNPLFIISTKPPPVQEVRTIGLPDDIVDLFELGWTADWTRRPSAHELLQHSAFLGPSSMEVSLEEDSAEGAVGAFALVARDASCLSSRQAEQLDDLQNSLQPNLDIFTANDEPDVAVTRAKRLMFSSEVQPREDEDAEMKEEAHGLDAALAGCSLRDTTVEQGALKRAADLLTNIPRHATPVYQDIPVLEARPRRRQYNPADEHMRVLEGLQPADTLPHSQSSGKFPPKGSDRRKLRQALPAAETSVQGVKTRRLLRQQAPFIPRLAIFDEDDNNNYCGARPKDPLQGPSAQRQPTRAKKHVSERHARNLAGGVCSPKTSPDAKSETSSASSLSRFPDGNSSRSAGVMTAGGTAEMQQWISPHYQASISSTRSSRRDRRQWYSSDSCAPDEDDEKPGSVLTETDSAAADSLEILASDTSTNYHLSWLEDLKNSSKEDVDQEVHRQLVAELEEQLPSISPQGLKVRFSAMSGKILAEILRLEISTDTWEDVVKMAAEKIHAADVCCFTAVHVSGQHLTLEEQLSVYLARGDNAIEVVVLPVATEGDEDDASLGSHHYGYETNWQWRIYNGNIENQIKNDNKMTP